MVVLNTNVNLNIKKMFLILTQLVCLSCIDTASPSLLSIMRRDACERIKVKKIKCDLRIISYDCFRRCITSSHGKSCVGSVLTFYNLISSPPM